MLKFKRKNRTGKLYKEFPSDDENIIYIVILKILESYHLEFGEHNRKKKSTYEKHFLPLAVELY